MKRETFEVDGNGFVVNTQFTENEKYRIQLCVKYARQELSTKLLKLEIEYESHKCYDAKFEQEMNQTRESIAFYDALIDKLEKFNLH